jgi:hypothetical protein
MVVAIFLVLLFTSILPSTTTPPTIDQPIESSSSEIPASSTGTPVEVVIDSYGLTNDVALEGEKIVKSCYANTDRKKFASYPANKN